MEQRAQPKAWTIGYGDRPLEEFLGLLEAHGIQVVVDVRRFPASKIEHFRRENLERSLSERGVAYVWLGRELGGYRAGGYEKHMETELFKSGFARLVEIVGERRACVMCRETNPRYCHRRFISRELEKIGVEVLHIVGGKLARSRRPS